MQDRIGVIKTKWELVLQNINKEIARINKEMNNPELQSDLKEKWDVLGNYSLKFMVKEQTGYLESVIIQLTNKDEAYVQYLKEIYEEIDDMMREEYQDQIRPEPEIFKDLNLRPTDFHHAIVKPEVNPEEALVTTKAKESVNTDELDPETEGEDFAMAKAYDKPITVKTKYGEIEPNKLPKETKMTIVKKAYVEMPVDKRTLGKIRDRTGIGKGSIYKYLKEMKLPLSGGKYNKQKQIKRIREIQKENKRKELEEIDTTDSEYQTETKETHDVHEVTED